MDLIKLPKCDDFFDAQIVEEAALQILYCDKIVDLKGRVTRVRTRYMRGQRKECKKCLEDAIDCLGPKDRLELKLSRLTQLADEIFDGVKEYKVICYKGFV
ncbi:hypothetical protein Tco_0492222 [Tanacetum coccineum]